VFAVYKMEVAIQTEKFKIALWMITTLGLGIVMIEVGKWFGIPLDLARKQPEALFLLPRGGRIGLVTKIYQLSLLFLLSATASVTVARLIEHSGWRRGVLLTALLVGSLSSVWSISEVLIILTYSALVLVKRHILQRVISAIQAGRR